MNASQSLLRSNSASMESKVNLVFGHSRGFSETFRSGNNKHSECDNQDVDVEYDNDPAEDESYCCQ
jgi:hypothetical protein